MSEKTEKNQVRNEIFRQMSLTLTLPLDIPVHPMDAKRLIAFQIKKMYIIHSIHFSHCQSLLARNSHQLSFPLLFVHSPVIK